MTAKKPARKSVTKRVRTREGIRTYGNTVDGAPITEPPPIHQRPTTHIEGCVITCNSAANEHTRAAVVALADALKANADALGKAADALKGNSNMTGIRIEATP